MTGLVLAIYLIVAYIVYFWWVRECKKFNGDVELTDEMRDEIKDSGFFFAACWIILVPCYFVMCLIDWFKGKFLKK